MAQWAVIIPANVWATERLFQHETLTVPMTGLPAGSAGTGGATSRADFPAGGGAGVSSGGSGGFVVAAVPAVEDDVLLVVADGSVVAQTRVVEAGAGEVVLEYVRRAFDEPVLADLLHLGSDLAPGLDKPHTSRTPGAAGDDTAPAPEEAGRDAFSGLSPFTAIGAEVFAEVAARLGADSDKQTWLVNVALPIEATSPAEAVRLFWSYVQDLGPAELPTYVSPSGNELAMQAFVLGEQANQDPEEEDED